MTTADYKNRIETLMSERNIPWTEAFDIVYREYWQIVPTLNTPSIDLTDQQLRKIVETWQNQPLQFITPKEGIQKLTEEEAVDQVTAVMREADTAFETVRGSTRHYVRDVFIPLLEKAGLCFCKTLPILIGFLLLGLVSRSQTLKDYNGIKFEDTGMKIIQRPTGVLITRVDMLITRKPMGVAFHKVGYRYYNLSTEEVYYTDDKKRRLPYDYHIWICEEH